MREGMLHIRDVEGPKKTGSVETRLEAMEQQVFKCQGMVERGLNANHMMITEFTNKHRINTDDIGKHLSTLYDKIDQLHGQIYDLQNQNCILADHGRQVIGIEEPPVYVVHEEPTSDAIRYFGPRCTSMEGIPRWNALIISQVERPPAKPKPVSLQPEKL
ncbi:40S ribosomal protein S5-1 [Hordeum vulgare]|nr:40S ribosomal protein S5-1 [Hordeum vulgare]